MANVLSFLMGWQVKIVLLIALIFSAYIWHKSEVKIAVNSAVVKSVNDIELQYNKELFKLKEKANEESLVLKTTIESQRKDTNAKIKSADARYNDLLVWVRSQPSGPSSNNRVSNNPSNTESTRGTYFGGLYTEDAITLAESSRSTERLKLELLTCYKQYDEVKDSLEDFKAKNSPRTH